MQCLTFITNYVCFSFFEPQSFTTWSLPVRKGEKKPLSSKTSSNQTKREERAARECWRKCCGWTLINTRLNRGGWTRHGERLWRKRQKRVRIIHNTLVVREASVSWQRGPSPFFPLTPIAPYSFSQGEVETTGKGWMSWHMSHLISPNCGKGGSLYKAPSNAVSAQTWSWSPEVVLEKYRQHMQSLEGGWLQRFWVILQKIN